MGRFDVNVPSALPGLQAFERGLDTRLGFERDKAAAGAQKQLHERAAQVFKTGTDEEMADFMIKNPSLAQDMNKADAFLSDRTKQNAIDSAWDVVTGKKQPSAAYIERAQMVQSEGGDPNRTLTIAEESQKNPDIGLRDAKVTLLRLDRESYLAYQKDQGLGPKEEQKPSPSTDLSRFVAMEREKWMQANPDKGEPPPQVLQDAFLKAKRAQAGEAGEVAASRKEAELGMIRKMQPGIERDKALATYQAKAEETRAGALIDRGLLAAESSATIRRGIELLELVETGGMDAAALAIKRTFGVEGADEGELSQALGKAVLSQLRETFGAQFTEEEGNRLIRLEAGFGKSVANNRRLLNQSLKIVNRTAQRARKAAKKRGDTDTVQDIDELLEFSLSTKEPLPEGVSEEQMAFTMDKYNLTREQVLARLAGQ